MSSPLKRFNVTIKDFIDDLKELLGQEDSLLQLETIVDITKVNARLIISQFQAIVIKTKFLEYILKEDTDYFLEYEYQEYMYNNYSKSFMLKLKEIVHNVKDNPHIVSKIFQWLKTLIYHALTDMGQDPVPIMRQFITS